jgi:hypothetical protein
MAVEIHRTIVTPDADGDVVELYVSDAPPEDASASFVLRLTTKVGPYDHPQVAQLQRAAMMIAADQLNELARDMAEGITGAGYGLKPRPK